MDAQAAAVVVRELDIPPVTACHATFSDVPCTDALYGSVQALADLGVTSGTAPGVFSPALPITRGQFAAFMSRADCAQRGNPAGCLVTPSQPSYDDVATSHSFYSVVETARARGWTQGDADGRAFHPDATMTRSAGASWLFRHMRTRDGLP